MSKQGSIATVTETKRDKDVAENISTMLVTSKNIGKDFKTSTLVLIVHG